MSYNYARMISTVHKIQAKISIFYVRTLKKHLKTFQRFKLTLTIISHSNIIFLTSFSSPGPNNVR